MNKKIYEKIRKLSTRLIQVEHINIDTIEEPNPSRKRRSRGNRRDNKQQINNLKDQL